VRMDLRRPKTGGPIHAGRQHGDGAWSVLQPCCVGETKVVGRVARLSHPSRYSRVPCPSRLWFSRRAGFDDLSLLLLCCAPLRCATARSTPSSLTLGVAQGRLFGRAVGIFLDVYPALAPQRMLRASGTVPGYSRSSRLAAGTGLSTPQTLPAADRKGGAGL